MSRFTLSLVPRALSIQKSLGTRRAAGYLRNRDVPLEEALIALGFEPRV